MDFRTWFGWMMRVQGHSMEPALRPGALVFVRPRVFNRCNPRRGDIVAVRPSAWGGRTFVKRVVGLPGDCVQVDGREWRLGEGEFFLLGDRSAVSVDSRVFGPVTRGELVGPVRLLGRRGGGAEATIEEGQSWASGLHVGMSA